MSSLPAPILLEVGRKFSWKLFFIVWVACVLGQIAVLPYTLTLQREAIAQTVLPMPLPILLALQVAQSAVILAVLAALGLSAAARIGLGLPFIEGWLTGQPIWNMLPRVALIAAAAGLVGGGIIVAIDLGFFSAPLEALANSFGVVVPDNIMPPAWQGFLASFYGGIAEEVQLRLAVMTLLAWLGRFVGKTDDNRPTSVVMWIANILAAILFGLGHLPAMQAIGFPITPLIIVRAVVLNSVVGMTAGWLYSRWGLESAMICHFSADIILHVITPIVVSLP